MEKILVLTHTQDDGSLPRLALEVVTAGLDLAKRLGGAPVSIGLVGLDVKAAADTLAGTGAATFLAVTGDDFAVSRYATDAAAAAAIIGAAEATVVLAPATARLARVLPGVAQRVGGRVDTRVTGIRGEGAELHVERWYYRQRMRAVMTRSQRPWIVVLESGAFAAWSGSAGSASLSPVAVAVTDAHRRSRVTGSQGASADAQTIRPDADLLFVAGAGWTKKQADGQVHIADAERLILGALDKAKASLGSSKSLVDQSGEGGTVLSFMSHMNQVGQTGATPRHPKGLATCCHGEEPHVVGWRFVNQRRAVNLDPGCGWAQGKADVLYVADAFAVVEKLNELL